MKKVTVIVPMYKAKAYVSPCVNALMRQGLGDRIEILLIDDRSPDDTFEYARELFKDNPLVRVIEQEVNGGPGKARNRGIQEATGEYICFADVDDMYVDNAISQMLETAEKENADVVHTNGVYFTVIETLPDDLSTIPRENLMDIIFARTSRDLYDESNYSIDDIGQRLKAWHNHECHWNVWGKLFRRVFLNENNIHFLNMKIGEDCLFIMKCVLTAKKYVQNNTFTYIYRIGESESVSRGKKNPKIFINAQMSLFESERHFDDEFREIPYLAENPEELAKLKAMEMATVKGPYVIAKYKEIGRDELSRNEEVIALFRQYFGEAAMEKMNELFDEYDNSETEVSAEEASSYKYWAMWKEKAKGRRVSLSGPQ